MIVGYARTSTLDQVAGLDAQRRDLEAAGCDKIWAEQVSSVAPRAQLDDALSYAREGDTFVVTRLDRLARSMSDFCRIADALKRRGVTLRVLNLGLDTATATGELMVQVLVAVAQFERAIMLERQREGIAKAKSDGKYRGRAPTARSKADSVRSMTVAGCDTATIAAALHISQRSVQRILQGMDFRKVPV